jgi:hypothetical protein
MENKRATGVVAVAYAEHMEPLMQAPGLASGMDTQKGIVHDIAHVVVGNERGISFPDGIHSHLHSDSKANGAVMEAPIDWTPFLDENGGGDPQKFKTKMADLAATYVAGGVANDLYDDIPFGKNPHVGADLRILKRYMRQVGFDDEEANMTIAQALLDAAKILVRPGVKDIVEQAASVREAGLDSRYHVSPERMDQILQNVKDAQMDTTETDAVEGLQMVTDSEFLKSLPFELPQGMDFVSYDQIRQGLLDCK